jgi:tRNA-splicing ligase RtcB
VEICVDQKGYVWLLLHSGSRGIGNQLANQHMKIAKKLAKEFHYNLEDPDLAYLMEGSVEFDAYIQDMLWAQHYAFNNRQVMMNNLQKVLTYFLSARNIYICGATKTINCHHNFTQKEVHNDEEIWVTRKGAIKADKNDAGIIPGSMGTKSYVVRGKGSSLSYRSCSHGAGRRMSRTKAKQTYSAQELANFMEGKIWNEDRAEHLVDEIPSSYKDIDQIMEDQKDLVEIEYELTQILNYKG